MDDRESKLQQQAMRHAQQQLSQSQQLQSQHFYGLNQSLKQLEAQRRAEDDKRIYDALEGFLKEHNIPNESYKKVAKDLEELLGLVEPRDFESLLKVYKLTKSFNDLKFNNKFEQIINSGSE